jgi:hypothetical protein
VGVDHFEGSGHTGTSHDIWFSSWFFQRVRVTARPQFNAFFDSKHIDYSIIMIPFFGYLNHTTYSSRMVCDRHKRQIQAVATEPKELITARPVSSSDNLKENDDEQEQNNDHDDEQEQENDNNNNKNKKSTKPKQRGGGFFPEKLYNLLEHTTQENLENIISWEEDGRTFCIHDIDAFVDDLLPKFFPNQSRFRSFERQLNLWGFGRLPDKKGQDRAYSKSGQPRRFVHPYFQRGDRSKCKQVVRHTIKGASYQASTGMRINLNIPEWATHPQEVALLALSSGPLSAYCFPAGIQQTSSNLPATMPDSDSFIQNYPSAISQKHTQQQRLLSADSSLASSKIPEIYLGIGRTSRRAEIGEDDNRMIGLLTLTREDKNNSCCATPPSLLRTLLASVEGQFDDANIDGSDAL